VVEMYEIRSDWSEKDVQVMTLDCKAALTHSQECDHVNTVSVELQSNPVIRRAFVQRLFPPYIRVRLIARTTVIIRESNIYLELSVTKNKL
jgi:hypothetical protein